MSESREEATLFENAAVGFAYFDADLCIRKLNRRAELLFGRRLDLVGRRIADLHLGDLDEATLRQTLSNGELKRLIHIGSKQGGRYLEVTCMPLPNADGQPVGVLLTAMDVTEYQLALRQQRARSEQLQREIENQLASLLIQSEADRQRLFSVIDQMPEGVLIISAPHGGLLAMNRTARELLDANAIDLTPGSTEYQRLVVFGPDGSPWPPEVRPIARALCGETVIGAQMSVEQRDGRRVDLLVNASPLHDRSNAISGAISVFQDIGELKELDRLKDDFISITSHELRTPLTTIKGYGQMMRRKLARLDPQDSIRTELQKPLDTILERTERMIVMINDLLDVSRIATGRFEVLGRAVDLSSIVTRCVEQVRLVQSLPVELYTPDELVLAIGDERLIEQVLNNLLGNAVKYSPDGGTIAVTLARDEANAIVQVRDEGIGIPPEQQEHLFERFYRSARSKGIATGLGLGLYISHGIITAHGGRLWVESAGPGQGSTFCFTLPLAGLLAGNLNVEDVVDTIEVIKDASGADQFDDLTLAVVLAQRLPGGVVNMLGRVQGHLLGKAKCLLLRRSEQIARLEAGEFGQLLCAAA